jgi:hypothetical protein
MNKIPAGFFILSLVLFGAACAKKTPTATTTNTSLDTNAYQQAHPTTSGSFTTNTSSSASTVSWNFTGSTWSSTGGTPPTCPSPLLTVSPVNLQDVTAILYPGQTRGGNYKPHGGFRFASASNTVSVVAPMDAVIVNGSRYIEGGETQYLFTFINPCGIMYRFDHLATLSPALQAIADTLPPAQVDDSRTTNITSGVSVKAGDSIARAVGFRTTNNVSVDFGLYDLRTTNTASQNAAYAASHSAEQAQHAICWLPLLPNGDATIAAGLPAGDQAAGKTSDYCR